MTDNPFDPNYIAPVESKTVSNAPVMSAPITSAGDGITVYTDLAQGTQEWFDARLGMLTASILKNFMTATGKRADNEKTRLAVYELAAQRVSGFIELGWSSDDTERGHQDEIEARDLYSKNYARVQEVGFVVNATLGFDLGCSPDGFVGSDGMIECKSRVQKHQLKTIVESTDDAPIPSDHAIQVQTSLLVTGRKWCDYITYCAGMPMTVIRVHRDEEVIAKIIESATAAEAQICKIVAAYRANIATMRHVNTVRIEREF